MWHRRRQQRARHLEHGRDDRVEIGVVHGGEQRQPDERGGEVLVCGSSWIDPSRARAYGDECSGT